jgi:hypothetical protein
VSRANKLISNPRRVQKILGCGIRKTQATRARQAPAYCVPLSKLNWAGRADKIGLRYSNEAALKARIEAHRSAFPEQARFARDATCATGLDAMWK